MHGKPDWRIGFLVGYLGIWVFGYLALLVVLEAKRMRINDALSLQIMLEIYCMYIAMKIYNLPFKVVALVYPPHGLPNLTLPVRRSLKAITGGLKVRHSLYHFISTRCHEWTILHNRLIQWLSRNEYYPRFLI